LRHSEIRPCHRTAAVGRLVVEKGLDVATQVVLIAAGDDDVTDCCDRLCSHGSESPISGPGHVADAAGHPHSCRPERRDVMFAAMAISAVTDTPEPAPTGEGAGALVDRIRIAYRSRLTCPESWRLPQSVEP
jgi:hypothetical protein